jgi:hypothetical protein
VLLITLYAFITSFKKKKKKNEKEQENEKKAL